MDPASVTAGPSRAWVYPRVCGGTYQGPGLESRYFLRTIGHPRREFHHSLEIFETMQQIESVACDTLVEGVG